MSSKCGEKGERLSSAVTNLTPRATSTSLNRALFAVLAIPLAASLVAHAQGSTPTRADIVEDLKRGDSQGALTLANQALRASPQECGLLSLKAVALTSLGQPQPALASFKAALVHCPAYLPALEGAAQIEYAQQTPGAIPLLTRILTIDTANVTAHAMLASSLRREHRCGEALPQFEASRPLFPGRPDLLEGYGSCLAQTGDLKAALTQYTQLLSSNPNNKIRYDVALLQWKTHADADALQTLAPLLQESPDEAALTLASRINEENGNTPRAVELLRTAILAAPDQTDNYLDFADIAFTHKSFQVGIDMLNAGLKRQPESAPLYVARGVLQVQLSNSDAAVADFEQAHRLDPTLSFAVDAIGLMQNQQHQPAQSLTLFQAQAKLHPDDPLLQYLLAEQLSEKAADAGSEDLAAAIAAAKRAVTLDHNYKAAHDLLAVLYVRAKQPALAIDEAELALAQDPDDQVALYQEIMARRRSGKTDQLPALIARLDTVRRHNEQRQQNVDRYRLQDAAAPPRPIDPKTAPQ